MSTIAGPVTRFRLNTIANNGVPGPAGIAGAAGSTGPAGPPGPGYLNVIDVAQAPYNARGNANFQNPTGLDWFVDSSFVTKATDDSAALAAAFTQAAAVATAGGSSIIRLSGNHYLATPQHSAYGGLNQFAFFIVPDNCTIDGAGSAWLRLAPGLNAMTTPNTGGWAILAANSNLSNVTIRGVNFDGNGQSGSPTSQGNSFISFLGNDTSNLVIEDCIFYNQSGQSTIIVTAVGSGLSGTNIRVANNIFEELGNCVTLDDHVGLYLQATGVAIVGNLFTNALADAAVVRNHGNSIQLQGVSAVVSGNSFYNQSNAFLLCSAFSTPHFQSQDVAFVGNTCELVCVGVAFAQAVGLTMSDITISGNTFSGCDSTSGIQASAVQVLANNASNGLGINRMTITDNTMVYANTGLSSAAGAAVYFQGVVTSCIVANNVMKNWPSQAITFEPTASANPNAPTGNVVTADLKIFDVSIHHNQIQDCGSSLAVALSCDTASSACQRISICDNTISSTGSAQAVGIAAVVAGDSLTILGNQTQNITLPYEYSSSNGMTNVITYGPLGDTGATLPLGISGHTVTWVGQPLLANGQYLQSAHTTSGVIYTLGVDASNNIRLGADGTELTIIGNPTSSSGAAANDLLLKSGSALRWGDSSTALHSIEFDGTYMYISKDGDPIRFGLGLGSAAGGSLAVNGSGIGNAGNPQTATQNGWAKFFDSSGNPFWVPAWR